MNLIKLLSGVAQYPMVSHPQPPSKVSQARWAHPAANPQIYKGIGEATDKPPSLDTKGK